MNFDGYYEKIERIIKRTHSLESLIVRKKRISIGNFGLPYKTKQGCLVTHRYTAFKEDKLNRVNVNDDADEL